MYIGKIYSNKDLVEEFKLECTDECGEKQVNIDLASFNLYDFAGRGQKTYQVSQGGYVVFYDSKYNNEYRLRLEKLSKSERGKVDFDTSKLEKGDIYSTVFLQPGQYEAKFSGNNDKSLKIMVEYPEKPDFRQRNQAIVPEQVVVNEKGFDKQDIKMLPGKGLVFLFEGSGDIQIKMVKPYEKKPVQTPSTPPAKPEKRKKKILKKVHWENPKYRQNK